MRAKEIRSIASWELEEDDRELLNTLAGEYDRLARLAEARGRTAAG